MRKQQIAEREARREAARQRIAADAAALGLTPQQYRETVVQLWATCLRELNAELEAEAARAEQEAAEARSGPEETP